MAHKFLLTFEKKEVMKIFSKNVLYGTVMAHTYYVKLSTSRRFKCCSENIYVYYTDGNGHSGPTKFNYFYIVSPGKEENSKENREY